MQDWTSATHSELFEAGKKVGSEIFQANFREVEPLGSPGVEDKEDFKENLFDALNSAEENYRCFSPFEFFAKDLNDREDSEEVWESYEDGIHRAWEEAWDSCQVPILEAKAKELTEELLNEICGTVSVCGYDYDAGRALRLLDYQAFWQEMLSYLDNEGMELA